MKSLLKLSKFMIGKKDEVLWLEILQGFDLGINTRSKTMNLTFTTS